MIDSKMITKRNTGGVGRTALALALWMIGAGVSMAQDSNLPLSFGGDAAVVSKYIWRGQRLTNDWSFQPAATLGIGNFSFNIWGTMDLTAVNAGDSLFLPEDPEAPSGNHSGLRGKFSEVDYTFSYTQSVGNVGVDVGTIFYTFPDRSASLPATTEIYGGVAFEMVPLAPSLTLYVDVDESGASGDTGVYFLLGAGHSLRFNNPIFAGLDISGSLSFANGGFGSFYYGESNSGAHDASITFALPITLGEQISANAFLTYSALLADFRDFQFQDPREVLLGTAKGPATYADTVWGGFSFSIGF